MNTEHTKAIRQLLDVAHSILAPDMIGLLPDEYVAKVREAIAAAEQAQQADIGKAISQQSKPVALAVLVRVAADTALWIRRNDRIPNDKEMADIVWPFAAKPPAVAVSVPDGYALVPIKPTDSMLDAAVSAGDEPGSDYYTIYAAMLAAAPQAATLSAALADIAAERRRQIEAEGWTPEHDDAHSDGQMATAAACYAISAHSQLRYKRIIMPSWWPWDSTWWKPSTTRRDLVKAGALIAAEIERIDRTAQKGGA